jgi:hypothetical protein
MTWLVLQFDDAGAEPVAVWCKSGRMVHESTGINHRHIVLFDDEDAAWRTVERNHRHGEVWGVISSEMLARKLRTGRYAP